MLHRNTVWHDERVGPVQVAVCLLDEHWEPLREVVEPVGPFDSAVEALERARARLDQWLACYGVQQELRADS